MVDTDEVLTPLPLSGSGGFNLLYYPSFTLQLQPGGDTILQGKRNQRGISAMAGVKGKTGTHANRSNQWLAGTAQKERSDEPFAFKPRLSIAAAIKADMERLGLTKTEWLDMATESFLGVSETEPESEETGLNHPLIQEALSDSLEKKRIAIARERKAKRPNQKMIEAWEKEIIELETMLGEA